MATIGDYINDELKELRLSLTESQSEVLFTKNGISGEDLISTDNIEIVEIALVNMIPKLLLLPDKTTGDTSLKWDRTAIRAYYDLKCDEYGIVNVLAQENSINDISDLW